MIISIIGFGSIGNHYLNILKSLKKGKINKILIFDKKKTNIKKNKYFEFINIKNIDRYINIIDLAIIATPSHLHFKYAKFFLENNIEVMVEKPAVLKIKDAITLSKLSN